MYEFQELTKSFAFPQIHLNAKPVPHSWYQLRIYGDYAAQQSGWAQSMRVKFCTCHSIGSAEDAGRCFAQRAPYTVVEIIGAVAPSSEKDKAAVREWTNIFISQ
jgi:hypothetical protein